MQEVLIKSKLPVFNPQDDIGIIDCREIVGIFPHVVVSGNFLRCGPVARLQTFSLEAACRKTGWTWLLTMGCWMNLLRWF